MNVQVRLFAIAKQEANRDAIELELPRGATVAELRAAVIARLPSLAAFGSQIRFAVNAEFAEDGAVIQQGDEIACIPPVSGG